MIIMMMTYQHLSFNERQSCRPDNTNKVACNSVLTICRRYPTDTEPKLKITPPPPTTVKKRTESRGTRLGEPGKGHDGGIKIYIWNIQLAQNFLSLWRHMTKSLSSFLLNVSPRNRSRHFPKSRPSHKLGAVSGICWCGDSKVFVVLWQPLVSCKVGGTLRLSPQCA
jgi:hypothetical protein